MVLYRLEGLIAFMRTYTDHKSTLKKQNTDIYLIETTLSGRDI